jgi:hypothetical protein
MRKVILAWLCLASSAYGCEVLPHVVGLHLRSIHSAPGFNDNNLGASLRWRCGLTLGALTNSVQRPSAYAGYTFNFAEHEKFSAAVTVGGISGYRTTTEYSVRGQKTQAPRKGLEPFVIPSVAYAFRPSTAVRLLYLAKVKAEGASALHLTLEFGI